MARSRRPQKASPLPEDDDEEEEEEEEQQDTLRATTGWTKPTR